MNSLEDFHEDILGKAMRGLGIGKNEMASRLECEKSEVDAILSGGVDESLILQAWLRSLIWMLKNFCGQPIKNGALPHWQ